MADMIRAAEELRRFSRSLKAVLELCDTLDEHGSLENYLKEIKANQHNAEAELAKVRKQVEEAHAVLTLTAARIENAKAEAVKIIDAATDEARGIKATAKEQAAKIVDAATAKAKSIEQSTVEAEGRLAGTVARITAAHDELTELEAKKAQIFDQLRSITQPKV